MRYRTGERGEYSPGTSSTRDRKVKRGATDVAHDRLGPAATCLEGPCSRSRHQRILDEQRPFLAAAGDLVLPNPSPVDQVRARIDQDWSREAAAGSDGCGKGQARAHS